MSPTRVLVTGAGGQLGGELVGIFEAKGCLVEAADRSRLDVTDRAAVLAATEAFLPQLVVHAAAWTAVDACESDPDRAFANNALATRNVAEGCRRSGAYLLYVSTDYVFEGSSGPYVEWDPTGPLSVYGRSKLGGELELGPGDAVVRTSWVCGSRGANFVRTMLRLAGGSGEVKVVDDQWGSPAIVSDLAAAIVGLALERRPGTWHVTNQGETNWHSFARAIFQAAGADAGRVVPISSAELDPPRPAPRPMRATLDNAALRLAGLPLLPHWSDSLPALVKTLQG